jgi:hypothetical protein
VEEMAITDFFKVNQYKEQIQQLQQENSRLLSLLTPEHNELGTLRLSIDNAKQELNNLQSQIQQLNIDQEKLSDHIIDLNDEIANKQAEIVVLDDEITLQDFGIFTPLYDAMSSTQLKEKLLQCRQKQKDLIKNDTACTYSINWIINGSQAEGEKMIKDSICQLLRSFNNECESIIDKVKFNNYDSIKKRIENSAESHNSMNAVNKITLNTTYTELKIEKLNLVYSFKLQKEREKEDARAEREALREQRKLEIEAKKEREKIEKEKLHFINAYKEIQSYLDGELDAAERKIYQDKALEMENQLTELGKKVEDLDYRISNTRAGYVYIISNIGSFGEDVFKIGVTRRLDPYERVRELGGPSVPFKFDVHAMIFSDDAPALELALHHHFSKNKVNLINSRREFFKADLHNIETAIRENYSKTFEISYLPEAEEYRMSEKIRSDESVEVNELSENELIPNDEE